MTYETELYYYRARHYDPELGRFLQVDPIGYFGGINLYAYVGNNPANWIDPYGLEAATFTIAGVVIAKSVANTLVGTVLGAISGGIAGASDAPGDQWSGVNAAKGAVAGAVGGTIAGAISNVPFVGNPVGGTVGGAASASIYAALTGVPVLSPLMKEAYNLGSMEFMLAGIYSYGTGASIYSEEMNKAAEIGAVLGGVGGLLDCCWHLPIASTLFGAGGGVFLNKAKHLTSNKARQKALDSVVNSGTCIPTQKP